MIHNNLRRVRWASSPLRHSHGCPQLAAPDTPAESPAHPDDLATTVFERLGVGLGHAMRDAQGRPYPLCSGRPVRELF